MLAWKISKSTFPLVFLPVFFFPSFSMGNPLSIHTSWLPFCKYLFIKNRLGLRPRGKESKCSLFHDLQSEEAAVGDGGDVLDLLGWQQGCVRVDGLCPLLGFFCPLAQTLPFCISRLSHRFILVEMVKGVVFQDLWISTGSDKLSFIDQTYIYNARGQSQMLPAETKNIVDSHCLCPCNCRCLTNKKWKQNRWTDPKGNPLQMNLRRELVSCFSLRRSIKLGFAVSCTEMYRCLSE